MVLFLFIGLLVSYLLPYTVQAQNLETKENTAEHYFLNNFKCSVEVSPRRNFVEVFESKYNFQFGYGVGFGYHFFRHKHSQLGVVKKSLFDYENVSIEAGNAFYSIETGIKYPEMYTFSYPSLGSTNSFSITESFLVFPLTLQGAWPDFFAGGTYSTFFLSYNIKCLLKAHYAPPQSNGSSLNPDFLVEIPNLEGHIAGVKTLAYSISVGGGFLCLWGLYLDAAFDFPISTSNNAIYQNNICKNASDDKFTSTIFDHMGFSLRLGLDILRVIRSFKGMQDDNTPTSIRRTRY
ncbi:MAG: hypothetical protein AAFP00_09190 [Bacteroidota bacterium]